MTQRQQVKTAAVLLLSLAAAAATLSLVGCLAGTTGILRPVDPAIEHTITNAVAAASAAATAAPANPIGVIFQGITSAALAVLAAWQAISHSRITAVTKTIAANNNKNKV
jgi:hypothetical protein